MTRFSKNIEQLKQLYRSNKEKFVTSNIRKKKFTIENTSNKNIKISNNICNKKIVINNKKNRKRKITNILNLRK